MWGMKSAPCGVYMMVWKHINLLQQENIHLAVTEPQWTQHAAAVSIYQLLQSAGSSSSCRALAACTQRCKEANFHAPHPHPPIAPTPEGNGEEERWWSQTRRTSSLFFFTVETKSWGNMPQEARDDKSVTWHGQKHREEETVPRSQLFPIIWGEDTQSQTGLAEAAATCQPMRLSCKRPSSSHEHPRLGVPPDLPLPPQHRILRPPPHGPSSPISALLALSTSLSLHSAEILTLALSLSLSRSLSQSTEVLPHLFNQSSNCTVLLSLLSLDFLLSSPSLSADAPPSLSLSLSLSAAAQLQPRSLSLSSSSSSSLPPELHVSALRG